MMTKTNRKVKSKSKTRKYSTTDDSNDVIESSISSIWGADFKIHAPFYLTPHQKTFYDDLKAGDTQIAFVDGPAGTAKSYLAVLAGLELLKAEEFSNILYIRSVIESASKSIGALPGEVDDKFLPYAAPLIEKVSEIAGTSTAAHLRSKGLITAVPVNFVRGLTFNNSFVIIDEAQNLTRSELVTIMTRFGKNSRYVICGDTNQSDIGASSGFNDIFRSFDCADDAENQGIFCNVFTENDIVRSKILRYIVSVLS